MSRLVPPRTCHSNSLESEKNSPQPITKAIRLKPSVTVFVTFVATTSKVLGTTGPASRKTMPNERVRSLARLNRASGAH